MPEEAPTGPEEGASSPENNNEGGGIPGQQGVDALDGKQTLEQLSKAYIHALEKIKREFYDVIISDHYYVSLPEDSEASIKESHEYHVNLLMNLKSILNKEELTDQDWQNHILKLINDLTPEMAMTIIENLPKYASQLPGYIEEENKDVIQVILNSSTEDDKNKIRLLQRYIQEIEQALGKKAGQNSDTSN